MLDGLHGEARNMLKQIDENKVIKDRGQTVHVKRHMLAVLSAFSQRNELELNVRSNRQTLR